MVSGLAAYAALCAYSVLLLKWRSRGVCRRETSLVALLHEKFPKHWAALSSYRSGKSAPSIQKVVVQRFVRRLKLTQSLLLRVQLESLLTYLNGQPLNPSSLEVRASQIEEAGNGLFAGRTFTAGELICVYSGREMGLREAMRCTDTTYVMGGFGINVHIDAKDMPHVLARYINDNFDKSCVNCKFVKLKREKKALVVATKAIFRGEELYASYGDGYWRNK